jgi:hypothetical protein
LWRPFFNQNQSRTCVLKIRRTGRIFAGKSDKRLEISGKFLLAFFM